MFRSCITVGAIVVSSGVPLSLVAGVGMAASVVEALDFIAVATLPLVGVVVVVAEAFEATD